MAQSSGTAGHSQRRTTRRPGMPRKNRVPNRITLRMVRSLYDEMNVVCEEQDITQREFVEAALREELADPQPSNGEGQGEIARTGMWIDPKLVREMDKRIVKERKQRTTQRGLLERAVARRIKKLRA